MKKLLPILLLTLCLLAIANYLPAQCSLCTKTAQQLGDKPARGLNLSIFFLAFTPLILMGALWYLWYKNDKLPE